LLLRTAPKAVERHENRLRFNQDLQPKIFRSLGAVADNFCRNAAQEVRFHIVLCVSADSF
jgi:hypothetical protein